MRKVAIIGLGEVSKSHISGLKNNSDNYKIVAICDNNESLSSVAQKHGVPFYANYKKVVEQADIDLVVVLTPPATHYEIAKSALENKKHVLIEKPGVLNINHLYNLIEIAKENNVTIDVMFHWQHGNEVLEIKDKLHTFGKLKRIEVNAYDPYTLADQKTIKPTALGLGGAWNDSGINILSMLIKFIDITQLKLKSEYVEYDTQNNLPIFLNKKFDLDGLNVNINVDWRENKNHKFTNFFFEEGTLFVHHTAQEVWFNSNRVSSFYNENRLATHYTNLFKSTKLNNENLNDTVELHKILLKN